MTSSARGKRTSKAEVTNLSKHGFWVLVQGRELFLPFESFPWFKRASVEEILHVEMPSPGHLYWPALDVDLSVESLENPDAFPLLAREVPDHAGPQRARGEHPAKPRRRAGLREPD